MASKSPELSQLLCFDLYAASRAVTACYRPLLEPLGLTYPQYLVMVVLWQRRTGTVKDLATELQLDYGTLTPLLRRLQANGLITRERNAKDDRSVTVGLTDAGDALRRPGQRVHLAICEALGLSSQQATELQATLRRLTTAATSRTA
jgi:DNA-binding MarR family transcriptional regulator